MIRATFQVDNIQTVEDGDSVQKTITLLPFHESPSNPDPWDNQEFWIGSPTGEIKLCVVEKNIWKDFDLGKKFHVDFSEV